MKTLQSFQHQNLKEVHFPNIGRSVTVNFRHDPGELGGHRDGDSGWNGGSNWGGSGGGYDFWNGYYHFIVYRILFFLVLLVIKILHWVFKRWKNL